MDPENAATVLMAEILQSKLKKYSTTFSKMDRSIRLTLWNANVVTHIRNELKHFAFESQVDAVLLTETRLTDSANFNFSGFQV